MKGYLIDCGFRDVRYFVPDIFAKKYRGSLYHTGPMARFIKELIEEHSVAYPDTQPNITVTEGEFVPTPPTPDEGAV